MPNPSPSPRLTTTRHRNKKIGKTFGEVFATSSDLYYAPSRRSYMSFSRHGRSDNLTISDATKNTRYNRSLGYADNNHESHNNNYYESHNNISYNKAKLPPQQPGPNHLVGGSYAYSNLGSSHRSNNIPNQELGEELSDNCQNNTTVNKDNNRSDVLISRKGGSSSLSSYTCRYTGSPGLEESPQRRQVPTSSPPHMKNFSPSLPSGNNYRSGGKPPIPLQPARTQHQAHQEMGTHRSPDTPTTITPILTPGTAVGPSGSGTRADPVSSPNIERRGSNGTAVVKIAPMKAQTPTDFDVSTDKVKGWNNSPNTRSKQARSPNIHQEQPLQNTLFYNESRSGETSSGGEAAHRESSDHARKELLETATLIKENDYDKNPAIRKSGNPPDLGNFSSESSSRCRQTSSNSRHAWSQSEVHRSRQDSNSGNLRHGMLRHGMSRDGMSRHGMSRDGMSRDGMSHRSTVHGSSGNESQSKHEFSTKSRSRQESKQESSSTSKLLQESSDTSKLSTFFRLHDFLLKTHVSSVFGALREEKLIEEYECSHLTRLYDSQHHMRKDLFKVYAAFAEEQISLKEFVQDLKDICS